MDYRIFNVRMRSCLYAYTQGRTSVHSLTQTTFAGYKVCEEFWLRGNRPRSAHKASHETVTHPWGNHARSCLTTDFESECFRCTLPTLPCFTTLKAARSLDLACMRCTELPHQLEQWIGPFLFESSHGGSRDRKRGWDLQKKKGKSVWGFCRLHRNLHPINLAFNIGYLRDLTSWIFSRRGQL